MTGCVTVLLTAVLLVGPAICQAPAGLPAFEVVEVKPSDPAVLTPGRGRILPGGRIEIHCMTARRLLMLAYGVKEYMIAGAPKWIDNDRFDMVAKVPAAAGEPTVRLMFQALLAERFKLGFHREEKVMSAWASPSGIGATWKVVCAGGSAARSARRRQHAVGPRYSPCCGF